MPFQTCSPVNIQPIFLISIFTEKVDGATAKHPLKKLIGKKPLRNLCKETGVQNFSLAGFSLGGKFALATLEAFPEKTKGIILLAPDGIKTSFWYSLATYPAFFSKNFQKYGVSSG